MESVLFVAVVVMGIMLADQRKRLASLERQLREEPWRDLTATEVPSEAFRPDTAPPIRATGEDPVAAGPVATDPAVADPGDHATTPVAVAPAEARPPARQPDRQPARVVARAKSAGASVPAVSRPATVQPAAQDAAQDMALAMAAPVPGSPEWAPLAQPDSAAGPAATGFAVNFEDLFGRKLPIWAGGLTLLVAAVFLVRYSIESGLLSPLVRVVLGGLFGAALVGAAEIARRRAEWIDDPRVAQALAGAGIGALYAATLAAANLYALIGPASAFAGLTAITLAAGVLALRFGPPCAVLGLVGGLAAPALVHAAQPNAPLLAGYIGVLVAGLALLSRRQRWAWLGILALIGGAAWSTVMIAMGALESAGVVAVGLLILALSLALPALPAEVAGAQRDGITLRLVSAAVGALQLALLVATGGFTLLTWGLYALLSLAVLWLGHRVPAIRAVVAVPLLTALGLLLLWTQPQAWSFALVLGGIAAIYGGHALWRLRTAAELPLALLDAVGLAAVALGGFVAVQVQFSPTGPVSAQIALLLGLLPAAGAAMLWGLARQPGGRCFALTAGCAALLLAVALLSAAPGWSAPACLGAVSLLSLGLALRAGNWDLRFGALAFQVAALFALGFTGHADAEVLRLLEQAPQPDLVQALVRWSGAALSAAAMAWGMRRAPSEGGLVGPGQVVATLVAYGLVAQIVPADWLGLTAAAAVLLGQLLRERRPDLASLAVGATLGGLAALWALVPAAHWLGSVMASLGGEPVLVTALPGPGEALRRLLGPALLIGLALHRAGATIPSAPRRLAQGCVGTGVLIAIHVLYKQLFAIASADRFTALGLAERTVWELLLVAGGAMAWRWARRAQADAGRPVAALALIGAALGHGLGYTVLLHNPLWADQAIGAWPVANLLIPAYGGLFAALWLLPQALKPDGVSASRRLATGLAVARMGLIGLFVLTSLRQLFAGSLPATVAVGSAEDIAWSLAAVALAIGYLLWGIRKADRTWRLGSLVLMLGAVGKVFLFDASGLEGLARIASFLALGFSLIGIGWLYSRYLKADAQAIGG